MPQKQAEGNENPITIVIVNDEGNAVKWGGGGDRNAEKPEAEEIDRSGRQRENKKMIKYSEAKKRGRIAIKFFVQFLGGIQRR